MSLIQPTALTNLSIKPLPVLDEMIVRWTYIERRYSHMI